ncbi:MAG: RidA family protein [Clostridiales bacterium]|nr:RidA family protein [Clostridiales bacterium]
MKSIVSTKNAPGAIGPYSQAVSADNMLFLSGQLPIDKDSGLMPETIKEQTRQSLSNAGAIIESAGATMRDVVKTTVFLSDMSNFGEMNEVYKEFFAENYPARSAVEVARLPKDALVEIEMIVIY